MPTQVALARVKNCNIFYVFLTHYRKLKLERLGFFRANVAYRIELVRNLYSIADIKFSQKRTAPSWLSIRCRHFAGFDEALEPT
jgi:hypothetical protein